MSRVQSYYEGLIEKVLSNKKILLFFLLEIIVVIGFEMSFDHFSIKKVLVVFFMVFCIVMLLGKNTAKNVFVIISTFGVAFSLLSPVFDVWDEDAHFIRSVYISEGNLWLSNEEDELIVSDDVKLVSGLSEYEQRNEKKMPNFLETKLWEYKHTDEKSFESKITSTNAYSFVSYLPSTLGYVIGKVISNGNLGTMFYLGRIANVLFYALCAMIAVKLSLKWNKIFAFFSIQPMVIYVSSSFNQDAFTYGLILIVFAYFINLLQREEKSISFKDVSLFTLLCFLMIMTKLPYMTLAGLLIFIPKSKFKTTATYLTSFIGIFIVIIGGIWWLLTYSEIVGHLPAGSEDEVDMLGQIAFITDNFSSFLKILATNLVSTLTKYYQLSSLAWGSQSATELGLVNLSLLVLPLIYPIPKHEEITFFTKIGVFLVSLVTMVLIYLSMYLAWNEVGSEIINGVQGRYFFGVILSLPIFMNFSKHIGYVEEKKNNNILLFVGMSLLIWAIAVRIGIYY